MSNVFNTSGNYLANPISATHNADGSYTYKATLAGLPVTWVENSTTYNCTAEVEITITTPTNMPIVSSGGANMFRFDSDGGYNVHITGDRWT
jgi:hypothetical protein